MIDINKHRFSLFQILKSIYTDKELAGIMGFKGGTALMFFYGLPRFSVDLDFNLLDVSKEESVFQKVREIIMKYGKIHDEAKKFFGIICVFDYGARERKLKIEISNRNFGDRYEVKNLMGVNMQVMVAPDMFAHKLCALLDRTTLANRDIFDCWFFMNKKTPVNRQIVELRMQMSLSEYLQKCIDAIRGESDKSVLNGLGEILNEDMKKFVRSKLRTDTITLLEFYKQYPILDR